MEDITTRREHAPRAVPGRGGWQQGFGDGLSQAVSMVLTPTLFVLLGVWLDRSLGTGPFLAVALGAVAVVGMFVVTYYEYRAKMARAEEGKPWTRERA